MRLSNYSIAIVVLAAGSGRRMGLEQGSKLLMALHDGEPIISHTIRNASALEPAELVVVIRPELPGLANVVAGGRAITPNVKYVQNARYEQGMATSLAAGIASLGDRIEAALVMLGDMPYVDSRIVEALVTAYSREYKAITIPMYGSAVGPPTLFARQAFSDLLGLRDEIGGRQLLTIYPDSATLVPFREEDRPFDVDTPEDFERLQGAIQKSLREI